MGCSTISYPTRNLPDTVRFYEDVWAWKGARHNLAFPERRCTAGNGGGATVDISRTENAEARSGSPPSAFASYGFEA